MALSVAASARPFTRVAPCVRAFTRPMISRRSLAVSASAAKEVFTAQEAADLLKQGYQYVDVRTPEEFAAGRAPGAVNIPLGPELVSGFKAKFPKGDEKLVVACQGGVRSTKALEALAGAYPQAVNFRGSFAAWAGSGMPIEK